MSEMFKPTTFDVQPPRKNDETHCETLKVTLPDGRRIWIDILQNDELGVFGHITLHGTKESPGLSDITESFRF